MKNEHIVFPYVAGISVELQSVFFQTQNVCIFESWQYAEKEPN